MEEELVAPIPNPYVQQHLFLITRPYTDNETRAKKVEALLTQIEKDGTYDAKRSDLHSHGAIL